MFIRSVVFVFVFVGALFSQSVLAATQGRAGKTSSGSFTIRLVIHPTIQASVVQNSPLVEVAAPNEVLLNQKAQLCVETTGLDQYSLSATGSASDGSFYLSGTEERIPYDVTLWAAQQTHTFSNNSAQNNVLLDSAKTNCSTNPNTFSVGLTSSYENTSPLSGALNFTVTAE